MDSESLIYNILKQFTLYALKFNNSNVENMPNFHERFQKVLNSLNVHYLRWFQVLKTKTSAQLQTIYLGLVHSNYEFLNSDPLHSYIVLNLKSVIDKYNLEKLLLDNIQLMDNLKEKIKPYSYNVGFLAVEYDRKGTFPTAKEFCLATFSSIIHEKECENWLFKLGFYVHELKLTKLYIQGENIIPILKDHLKGVRVLTLKNCKTSIKCSKCKRWYCSVNRVNYYLKSLHNFRTHYVCDS